ncbi:MAG: EF-hand domain-containing protein [Proteobacteria bacterium]|nr:EF-hand domain-containing protein [Pseudomonadota bacterium]
MHFLLAAGAATALESLSDLGRLLVPAKVGAAGGIAPAAGAFSLDTAQATGGGNSTSGPNRNLAIGGRPALAPDTFGALVAAQNRAQPDIDAISARIFSRLDGDGDGKISQNEFASALRAKANPAVAGEIFARLDSDKDGGISPDELTQALGASRNRASTGGGDAPEAPQAVNAAGAPSAASNPRLKGAGSTSTVNADGSITTTVTYADGSKIVRTAPAASAASNTNIAGHRLIDRMIREQMQILATKPTGAAFATSA